MNRSQKVYLDYAATTPLDQRVFAAMAPFFTEQFGNPSSNHAWGRTAETALENSREKIAAMLNCSSSEIIFTSGGTESDNLALRGAALAARKLSGADHILISPVEHHAVSRTAEQLAELFGFELEYLAVDSTGRVDPQEVKQRIRKNTAVVSVIFANNEIGTINPIREIGAICKERQVVFHSDAVQAGAHFMIDTHELNLDFISLGAHKFFGPKGVGVLYARKDTPLVPVQTGGAQENNRRAGTSNIPYIVGMAEALSLVKEEHQERNRIEKSLRDRVIQQVLATIPDVKLTGHPIDRLPNHASFVFQGVDGNLLLMLLDNAGFACSSGSACKTGNPEPSEILYAVGLSRDWAMGSLRVTLSHETKAEEVDEFLEALPELVTKARRLSCLSNS